MRITRCCSRCRRRRSRRRRRRSRRRCRRKRRRKKRGRRAWMHFTMAAQWPHIDSKNTAIIHFMSSFKTQNATITIKGDHIYGYKKYFHNITTAT